MGPTEQHLKNYKADSPLWTGGRAILQIQTVINLLRNAGQIVVADAYLETAASMPAAYYDG